MAALTRTVRIGQRRLPGVLVVPARARGLVVFAHGSGSSRASPRARLLAGVLHEKRLATLLFDLGEPGTAATADQGPDVGALTASVTDALNWLREHEALGRQSVGLFGSGTGAAAALRAAAEQPARVSAVVSRGGRPDLAAGELPKVRAPTLLIAGGRDTEVLAINRGALPLLHCEKRLEVVPGAGRLFEEPGALDTVGHLAAAWFVNHGSEPLV